MPEDARDEAASVPIENRDRLEYLADMVSELQHMAQAAGYERLATLLTQAYDEARRHLPPSR